MQCKKRFIEKAMESTFDRIQDRQNSEAAFEDSMLERALEDWRASRDGVSL